VRRKRIRYRLLQGEGVMDRSALPVSACLTRRNGCVVPPSTMQKISCTAMRSPNAVSQKSVRGRTTREEKTKKKKRKEKDVSYVGVRAVCEDGDEDAPVESVGHAVCSECMREGTGGF
jgi:hypothetical protein